MRAEDVPLPDEDEDPDESKRKTVEETAEDAIDLTHHKRTKPTLKREIVERAHTLRQVREYQARVLERCVVPGPQYPGQRTVDRPHRDPVRTIVSAIEGGDDGGGAIIGAIGLLVLLALATPHGGGGGY